MLWGMVDIPGLELGAARMQLASDRLTTRFGYVDFFATGESFQLIFS